MTGNTNLQPRGKQHADIHLFDARWRSKCEAKGVYSAVNLSNHSDATGAPQFFVQVIFEEKRPDERFLGGETAAAHFWIRGDIRAGRTKAQREKLMLSIMRDVSRVAGVEEDSIWVYLCNLEPTDMLEYGHILPAPGDEKGWFQNLPASLRTYLAGLGTDSDNFSL